MPLYFCAHTRAHARTHTPLVAQLLREAQSYAQVTPLQISLLYELCSMDNPSSGAITMETFSRLLPQPARPIAPPVTVSTPSNSQLTEEVSRQISVVLGEQVVEAGNTIHNLCIYFQLFWS